jgi:hypothetical protein
VDVEVFSEKKQWKSAFFLMPQSFGQGTARLADDCSKWVEHRSGKVENCCVGWKMVAAGVFWKKYSVLVVLKIFFLALSQWFFATFLGVHEKKAIKICKNLATSLPSTKVEG